MSIIEEDIKKIVSTDLPWGGLEGKAILITGANGFLPSYMVRVLDYLNKNKFHKKVKIICLVRNKKKAQKRFSEIKDKNLRFIIQDVSDSINITQKVDFIVHAASQASPKYYGEDPVGTLLPNIVGTYNLLELARRHKPKAFLFFSSGEVYGEIDDKHIPTKESDYGFVDPTNVRSCYSESKRMGETMGISYFHQYGVPFKIVRPFHTYGPGMDLNDGRVFADFVAKVLNEEDIVLNSNGSAKRAFCYLSDATIGFFTVLLTGKSGEAYNVGNQNGEISILELAKILVGFSKNKNNKIIFDCEKEQKGYIKSEISRNCPDISKIKTLNWSPDCSVRDGFKRTIASFKEEK